MAEIRAIDRIVNKFTTVTPMRSGDYEYGVNNPRRSWSRATGNANDAWKAGLQDAIQKNRFSAGVKKAGDARWARGATEKGVQRWGPGVQLAGDDYRRGFAPYHQAISSMKLPQRYASRDPRNIERVKAVVDVMTKTKERLLQSGA